ncbi:hypothetical protein ACGP04_03575 [Piscirickettsia salmonis]|uniref:hypothetical protein n=1 Tax=Piscirickettsia salmonis TaxID=1238 RepID=UPI000F08E3DA|nr:hypothetical protein DA717_10605 [Piscirickettsiaceae bacterium NZ-RLO2]
MKQFAVYLLFLLFIAGCTKAPEQNSSYYSALNSSSVQGKIPNNSSIVNGALVTRGQQPYMSVNFSDNGKQLVYVSQNYRGEPVIYQVSQEQGRWLAPEQVVSLQSSIIELPGLHFSRFMTTNSDQPSVALGYVAFLAELTNGATGLFYAQKVDTGWQVHRVATTENRVHVGGSEYFSQFSHPNVLDDAIYFLATADQEQFLYRYDILTGLRTAIPVQNAQGVFLRNLRNLSFSGQSFAITADDAGGQEGVYAFEGYGSFRRLSPEYYNNISGEKISVKLGQMSYGRFGTQMSMITTANKQLSKQALIPQTGVYINVKGFNDKPALLTWQKVSGFEFLHFKTPLLLKASQDQASFIFVANTASAPQQMGVYKASITNGVVNVSPLLIPGEYLDKQRVIAVNIGDASVTRDQLAVSVQFSNGQEGVYLLSTS